MAIQDHVDTFHWKYYYFSLQYRGNMLVELNQTSTGDCDLYVQVNDIPTRSSYYVRDITTRTQVSANNPMTFADHPHFE